MCFISNRINAALRRHRDGWAGAVSDPQTLGVPIPLPWRALGRAKPAG
jgi:hypothetical protein